MSIAVSSSWVVAIGQVLHCFVLAIVRSIIDKVLLLKSKKMLTIQRLAGWCSWLSRIVNTDKVAGSSPALVINFLIF